MSTEMSSSPSQLELRIDTNDNENALQTPNQLSLKDKPEKLSFSISRLLDANSIDTKANDNNQEPTSESESESPSSRCSHCYSMDSTVAAICSSPDAKRLSSGSQMTIDSYDAMNHLSGASMIRTHRSALTMPYTTHYPWLGPTPTLIKSGLQSKQLNIV